MKNILIISALFISTLIFAQTNKPVFEKQGDLVVGTYYHDNGTVSQTGAYKDGKLHGEWISYNNEGNKVSVGNYNQGNKTGKWFFWDGDKLSEVNFNNNTIASIKTWEADSNVAVNFIKK